VVLVNYNISLAELLDYYWFQLAVETITGVDLDEIDFDEEAVSIKADVLARIEMEVSLGS
jgi:hypothetical protein